jgi:hypothetical protein
MYHSCLNSDSGYKVVVSKCVDFTRNASDYKILVPCYHAGCVPFSFRIRCSGLLIESFACLLIFSVVPCKVFCGLHVRLLVIGTLECYEYMNDKYWKGGGGSGRPVCGPFAKWFIECNQAFSCAILWWSGRTSSPVRRKSSSFIVPRKIDGEKIVQKLVFVRYWRKRNKNRKTASFDWRDVGGLRRFGLISSTTFYPLSRVCQATGGIGIRTLSFRGMNKTGRLPWRGSETWDGGHCSK